MGEKTQGVMWCANCNKPVMGVRNTSQLLNVISVIALLATAGVPAVGLIGEGLCMLNMRRTSDR